MKYQYTSVFAVEGLTLSPSEETLLVQGADVRGTLTNDPEPHLLHADRSAALAELMLKGMFAPDGSDASLADRLAAGVQQRRAERRQEFGHVPYLVIQVEGTTDDVKTGVERDAGDFIACFDASGKADLKAAAESQVVSLLTTLALEVPAVAGIRRVRDHLLFFRDDGRPIYSYQFQPGTARAYTSRPLSPEEQQAIGRSFPLLVSDTVLRRVQVLLQESYDRREDALRSFLAAWSALEVLVNKVFKQYESALLGRILAPPCPRPQAKYLERIREVMKDKYRFADKFAAISAQLSPDTAEHDTTTAEAAKRIRDRLLHGEIVDEGTLPAGDVRQLVVRYLRLHVHSQYS